MNSKIFSVNVGILASEDNNFYELKKSNITTRLFSNYIEFTKAIFGIMDHYSNTGFSYFHKRIIIWAEVHEPCEKYEPYEKFKLFESSCKQTYFYYYCGKKEEGEKFVLDIPSNKKIPKTYIEYNLYDVIKYYIPEGKEDEYKQAIMEYKLMNK